MIFCFGDFELDESRLELRRGGNVIEVQPRVLDLLFLLVKSADRVVRRDELLCQVWGDATVGDASLSRAIKEARRALGDDGEAQRYIRTSHGRGYAFVEVPEQRLVAPARSKTPVPPAPGPIPSEDLFVGRDPTTARALSTLERAFREGRGGTLVLVGEPGIGKTRALGEIARRALDRGAQVLSARCYPSGGAPPYFPWLQLLRSALAADLLTPDRLGASGEALAPLIPELSSGEPRPRPALDSADVRFAVERALAAAFHATAESAPLVLLVDDLHAADSATLMAARSVAELSRSAPLALVLAVRSTPERSLQRTLGDLLREGAELHELSGLEPDAVASLCRGRLGHDVDARVLSSLITRTRGNPFFLHQLLDLSVARSGSSRSAERFEAMPLWLQDAIARHVDMLPVSVQDVLTRAAVLGDPFSPGLASILSEGDRAEAITALERAEKAGVLARAEAPRGHYAFSHPLVREALYTTLPPRERARLHEAAARALETDGGYPEVPLARHLLRAPLDVRLTRGVSAGLRAAETAFENGAFDEAASIAEAVLETLALGEPRVDLERAALLRLGSALGRDGRLVEAARAFRQAAALPRQGPVDGATIPHDQADAVRSSFTLLADHAPDLIERVYDKLFRRYPEVRSLFGRNPTEVQARMLADTLTAALDHIEDVPWLRDALTALGARHVAYGVTDEMYDWFEEILMETFSEVAGSSWSPRTERAWRGAYHAIVAQLIHGARAVREARSQPPQVH